MQTAFRVTKSAARHGEPGPEGVHQGNAVLTAVLLMARKNCALASGGSRIWSLAQPCGKPGAADVASERLLFEAVLHDRLDALFLLDRE
eukprot:4218642-Pyramimonas_sp.AAC.1